MPFWVHHRITDSMKKNHSKLQSWNTMSADNAFCSFCNNARLVNNNLIWIISLHSSHPIKITLLWLEHYDLSTPQWCFVVKHFETVCDQERRKFMKFQFLAIKFTGISRCVVKFKIWIMESMRHGWRSIQLWTAIRVEIWYLHEFFRQKNV